MYITLDTKYPRVIREVRCAICETVIASLVPLDIEVDRKVETVGSITTVTIWKLSTLAYNNLSGGERSFTLDDSTSVSVPVCKMCCIKQLSSQEVAEALERTAVTTEVLYPDKVSSLGSILRSTARGVRGRDNREANS